MSGGISIDLRKLAPVRRRLAALSHMRLGQLYEALGSEVEAQTRRRLSEEKTDPDGEPWDDWSEAYAASRKSSGGILDLNGALIDSIAYEVTGSAVVVGSNMVYALVHNEGDDDMGIPERRYLGVSDENLDDLGELVMDFIAREARS